MRRAGTRHARPAGLLIAALALLAVLTAPDARADQEPATEANDAPDGIVYEDETRQVDMRGDCIRYADDLGREVTVGDCEEPDDPPRSPRPRPAPQATPGAKEPAQAPAPEESPAPAQAAPEPETTGATTPAPETTEPQETTAEGPDAPAACPAAPEDPVQAEVTRVIDGDTFELAAPVQGADRVRLIGVDTPELGDDTEPSEPYAEEAAAFTAQVLDGRPVTLQVGEDPTDDFGRLLAYAWTEDGDHFNRELLAEGYAEVMTVAPNDRHEDCFLAAEEGAREAGIGRWGEQPTSGTAATDPTESGVPEASTTPEETAPEETASEETASETTEPEETTDAAEAEEEPRFLGFIPIPFFGDAEPEDPAVQPTEQTGAEPADAEPAAGEPEEPAAPPDAAFAAQQPTAPEGTQPEGTQPEWGTDEPVVEETGSEETAPEQGFATEPATEAPAAEEPVAGEPATEEPAPAFGLGPEAEPVEEPAVEAVVEPEVEPEVEVRAVGPQAEQYQAASEAAVAAEGYDPVLPEETNAAGEVVPVVPDTGGEPGREPRGETHRPRALLFAGAFAAVVLLGAPFVLVLKPRNGP